MELSRRAFIAATAALTASRQTANAGRALTAAEIIARIRASVGMPWREKTLDGIKAGDPSTGVTGIVVTVMPTLDVLRRAAADRHNFVIVQEPTFYGADETPGSRANDPVYLAKKAFIDEHKLVIFRFTDHWHARRPNPAAVGLAEVLGWRNAQVDGNEFLHSVTPTTLGPLTAEVRKRMGARALRVVGQPDLPVRTVFVSPGTTGMASMLSHLPRADVVISGEPREWEAVPYALDTWPAGRGRGMIAIGRVVSLGPSAGIAAIWVRSLVSEVPVTVAAAPDPYWSPLA
jgi:putative NIF3 family GTP cyclohydrolase 1 type 2